MSIKKLLLGALVVGSSSMAMAQGVIVDGKPVAFDSPIRMVAGTMMVPVRSICEATGADMRWRMEKGVLEYLYKGTKVEIEVGNRRARVNDMRKDMDEASYVYQGRTYAPIKFLAESMGYMMSMEHGNVVLQPTKR
jgi:hypothetical protein